MRSWGSNKNLRLNINNGIILCEKHHVLFHREFGQKNNTEKQFKLFKQKEQKCIMASRQFSS